MNVPYDAAAGLRDIEAYRDECHDRMRNVQECLVELAEGIIEAADKASLGDLHELADDLEEYINDIKYNSDELRNIQNDYDSTL